VGEGAPVLQHKCKRVDNPGGFRSYFNVYHCLSPVKLPSLPSNSDKENSNCSMIKKRTKISVMLIRIEENSFIDPTIFFFFY